MKISQLTYILTKLFIKLLTFILLIAVLYTVSSMLLLKLQESLLK